MAWFGKRKGGSERLGWERMEGGSLRLVPHVRDLPCLSDPIGMVRSSKHSCRVHRKAFEKGTKNEVNRYTNLAADTLEEKLTSTRKTSMLSFLRKLIYMYYR